MNRGRGDNRDMYQGGSGQGTSRGGGGGSSGERGRGTGFGNYRGGNRGGGSTDGDRSERGRGGGFRGYGGDRSGGRGGGRGGRGGGRPTGQVVTDRPFNVPGKVMPDAIRGRNAQLGWVSMEACDNEKNPLPPRSKGPGKESLKVISLTTNNLELKKLNLPEPIYQYDVDIDLSDSDKVRKRRIEVGRGMTRGGRRGCGRGGIQSSDVRIKDPPNPKLWKRIVTSVLTKLIMADNDDRHFGTDYMKAIYTTYPLCQKTVDEGYNISLSEVEDETGSSAVYHCRITLVSKIHTAGELQTCVNNLGEWFLLGNKEMPEDLVNLDRILNIAVKTTLAQRYTPVGRVSFFPEPPNGNKGFDLGGGLVNWAGVSTIVTMGWKPYLNIDTANTAFIKEQCVYTAMKELFQADRLLNSKVDPADGSSFTKSAMEKALKFLKGCQISYKICAKKVQTGRVTDILTLPARMHKFVSETGETNVEAYFRHYHHITLKYPNGICLKLGGKSIVPAEVCKIKKGQPMNGKLTEFQTTQMITVTAVPPENRIGQIRTNITLINTASDPVLQQFGVTVENKLHETEARVLAPPTLVYGAADNPRAQKSLVPPPNGVWNMFEKNELHFVKPASALVAFKEKGGLVKWGIMAIRKRVVDKESIFNFIKKLWDIAKSVGLNLDHPNNVMENYEEVRDRNELVGALNRLSNCGCEMALCVLPYKDQEWYPYIKFASEVTMGERPILTQCIVGKTIDRCQEAVVQNVLFKINIKLGGFNYLMDGSPWERINILNTPVLIIGADVTHPGADSKYPSLVAVTASVDRTGVPFHMTIQAQRKADKGAAEVINGLDEIIRDFILAFINKTGFKPRKIIIFRDGVGDGQFGEVLNTEMLAIRRGCTLAGDIPNFWSMAKQDILLGEVESPKVGYQPKITFVAVQKRHKVRFFCNNPSRDGVGTGLNAPPGTIVDVDIVKAYSTDYYLLSHMGIQGTSKPTRYQILWDDSEFSSDDLQTLSYFLCFMYCRCTRSVSYPAPTYYAHLGATRAKDYTLTLSDDVLSNIQEINLSIQRSEVFKRTFPMHYV